MSHNEDGMLNFNKSHKVKYNHTEQDEEYRNLKLNTSKEYKANVFIDKETKLHEVYTIILIA